MGAGFAAVLTVMDEAASSPALALAVTALGVTVADIVAVRAGPLTLESFITMAKGRPVVERSWSRSSAAMMMKLGECRLRPRLWCEGVCVCVWQWLQAGRKGDLKARKGQVGRLAFRRGAEARTQQWR